MSISTHVLDISIGRPAAAVDVRLRRHEGHAWVEVVARRFPDDLTGFEGTGTPDIVSTEGVLHDVLSIGS